MTSDQRKIIELTIAADLERAAMIRSMADRDVQLGGWRGAYDLLHDEAMSAVRFNLNQLEK
jgi:hypothetical protein